MEKLLEVLNLKKQFLFIVAFQAIFMVLVYFYPGYGLPIIVAGVVLNTIIAIVLGTRSAKRSEAIAVNLQTIARGDLSKKFGLHGKDDFSWMAYESDTARRGVAKVIQGVTSISSELGNSAGELSSMASRSKEAVAQQGEKTQQIASSIGELASQIQDVAAQASQVAVSAKTANSAAVGGSKVVGQTIKSLEIISADVQGIAESINGLQDEINKISSVMQVIRDISEQTNLLALNAAIEAARAGEAGRGFAVVADEVRNLSQRTSKSTEEITQIITNLQNKSQLVAATVKEKQADANSAAGNAKSADEALIGIVDAVQTIVTMSDSIASLTARQESAAHGITDAVGYINGLSNQNAEEANKFYGMAQHLTDKSTMLNEMVSKFIV
jgi:methyl-accepting chemotaxis protein